MARVGPFPNVQILPHFRYCFGKTPFVKLTHDQSWGLPFQYTFTDIPSLDPSFLTDMPRPVHAVIFMFPDTPSIVAQRASERPYLSSDVDCEPLWIPQVDVGEPSYLLCVGIWTERFESGHSCGTFALVHALAQTGLAPGLQPFFDSCRGRFTSPASYSCDTLADSC